MSKFNAVVLTAADGTQIHFVTRGRAKPPLMDEIVEYMNDNDILLHDLEAEVKAEEELMENWKPANNKLFFSELRSGLAAMTTKYGVSEQVMESYLRRVAPHVNVHIYNKDKKNA